MAGSISNQTGNCIPAKYSLQSPFEVHGLFTGRSFSPIKIKLHGKPGLVFLFRRGLLYDDFAIAGPNGALLRHKKAMPGIQQLLAGIIQPLAGGLTTALALFLLFDFIRKPAPFPLPCPRFLLSFLLFAFLACTLWISSSVLEKLPHFEDDLCYLLRAKWLLEGHLYQPRPSFAQHLNIPFTFLLKDRWIGMYPIGWPLLLAAGEFLGSPWIIPPVLGTLHLWMIFLIGRELYGPKTGLLAVFLASLSPLVLLLSSSLLSHAATSLLLATAFYYFIRKKIFLCGCLLGFAFSIRPLTAFAAAAVMGLFLLSDRKWIPYGFGCITGALPALIDNFLVSGHPLQFAYNTMGVHLALRSWQVAFFIADHSLVMILPLAFGWAVPSFTYAFPLLTMMLKKPGRNELLLILLFVCLPAAHFFHYYTGVHGYGPRFYYDTFFALFILTARGIALLADLRRLPALLLTALLILSNLLWLPDRIREYRGYNFVTSDLEDSVRRLNINKGIILLKPGSSYNWIRSANLLPGKFPADIVVGQWLPDNSSIQKAFPGHPIYVWSDGRLIQQQK